VSLGAEIEISCKNRIRSAILILYKKIHRHISEFVLRSHLEITVNIRLVIQSWTDKKGSSRFLNILAGPELTAPEVS